MSPGKCVGGDGDEEGRNMGPHMAAIGKEGHGVHFQAADDFHRHHDGSQNQDAARAFFRRAEIPAKIMLVLPPSDVGHVHSTLDKAESGVIQGEV